MKTQIISEQEYLRAISTNINDEIELLLNHTQLAREDIKQTVVNKYKENFRKINKYICKIGFYIGVKDSLFNPLRKVTDVCIINDCVCFCYKEKFQKLERYEKINLKRH